MTELPYGVLKDLLLTTKDGDWGKAEAEENLLPYYIVRATDFAATSVGDVSNVPLRYLPMHTVARRTLQPNDILLETAGGSSKRPTGRTLLITDQILESFDNPVTCASFARFLRPDPKKVDPRYLFWFLQSLYRSGEIEKYQVQHTGVARFQYTQFAQTQQVPLPEIETQQAIGEVLGTLNDKIVANTKLATTAAHLMHASFQQLISESDFSESLVEDVVRRLKIPRKFTKAEILAEGEFPIYDQSDAGFLGYLSGDGYFDASADHPILYFGDHTCKLRISSERFVVGPNTIPFVARDVSTLVLYCALQGVQKHEEYKRHWNSLMKKAVRLPSHAAAQDFTAKFKGFFSWRHNLQSENSTLATTRDALLPHLVSGKLRIKDAEALREELV